MTRSASDADLRRIANRIRISSLEMVHRAKLGHPGGDLSASDILATLYFGVLRIDPLRPSDPERDRFRDGELQEGSNWEAAMAAAHYGLDNLTVIVDAIASSRAIAPRIRYVGAARAQMGIVRVGRSRA
jgi:transketolase N-terminal domain/subunit